MRIFIGLLLLLVAASCSSDSKNIPLALGLPGDVYFVMDSAQWKGPLGRTLDSIFSEEVPGLPRKESLFTTRWIDPRRLNAALKQRRNLIFVMTLDRNDQGARIVRALFTPESIEKVKSEPEKYNRTAADVFARNQEVLYLYSPNEELLRQHVIRNAPSLISHFNIKERERISHSLFKAGEMKGLTQLLQKEFHCEMRFPFGFKLADKDTNFVWFRQINPKDDKDIFIARKKYSSRQSFNKGELIAFRDEICKKYLFGDPARTDSYIVTEMRPYIPVTVDTVNFNGHFGMKMYGLYRSNDYLFGGPFVSFALVDEGRHEFYYLEGFTISPGRDQREIMRELETILYTFRTSKELTTAP